MNWETIIDGIWLFRDSCNVYALRGPGGIVVVNAGTGLWLNHLDQLPGRPVALLCTHYFRDHSAAAAAAARAGIPVFVPEGERSIFADPVQHFRQRETYIIYDNIWDLFAPIEPVPISGVLRDYDRVNIAGIDLEVIPLPGATPTQIGLGVTAGDGRQVVLCAEAIHSPGRLPRVAPLQYNYNDLSGAVGCYTAADTLRRRRPAALLPSLGEPILDGADAALEQLQRSLRHLLAGRPEAIYAIDTAEGPAIERVTDHVWRSLHSNSVSWFVISDSGKALVIDYGYAWHHMGYPAYSKPERRRALLHSLEGLKQQFGIDRPAVVLASHFHDDHVCGIPLLQRLYGTECWAAENFADLLEDPQAHCFPCCWPVPMKVDRRLRLDEPVRWEEYTFHLHPMSGHTRFSALIGFEADGRRFAHTGDQYFFTPGRDFATCSRRLNHVYRNGALLDGFEISDRWMLQWRPDVVLTGHSPAMFTDEHFFRHIEQWSGEYQEIHQGIMPLGADEEHFNLDSWGGWIWPYRVHLPEAGPATVKVTVRNPYPREAMLKVRLVGPPGWEGTSASLPAAGRQEVSCKLTITPAGPCRRQPFAVELTADDRPFGQVAEALMTVGGTAF